LRQRVLAVLVWAAEVEADRDLVLVAAGLVAVCLVAEEAVELARVVALEQVPEPVRWVRRVRAVQEHFGKRVERRVARVYREQAAAVAQAAELELVEVRAEAVELVAAVWVMAALAVAPLVETPSSKENG
jgi:hypothetical protein